MDALHSNSISNASNSSKSKSITGSNGNATNYVRQADSNYSLEYVSPTKKASDHSISQLISSPTSNHSAYVTTIKHQTQFSAHSSYTDNSATASVPNKSTQGSSSKSKFDGQHRSQTNANGSGNSNFVHNNNNNKVTSIQRSIPVDTIDLCDTDADEGEPMAKKSKSHKTKKDKKSKESEQRNNLALPNTVHLINQQLQQPSVTAATTGANASVSDEVDHNQIIHDLKVNSSFLRKYFDLKL